MVYHIVIVSVHSLLHTAFVFVYCLLIMIFGTSLQLEVIGIDEAQFFEDLYDFCCEVADHDGKTVIVAGLDGDYLRCCC